uniref:Uncharacterized protein n=1 Tax=Populus trichocarpa TaxID=3694 RepID=A0A2K1X358_POPTR
MISTEMIIKLARRWQKLAATRRKNKHSDTTHWENRYKHKIPRKLLKLAEEESGLSGDGPLTLPCDAALLDYVNALNKRHVTGEAEKALLMPIASNCCSCSSDHYHQVTDHKMPLYSSAG